MAKAVLLPQPPVPVKHDVQLTLSPAEAETLSAILIRIGGDPSKTRRGEADKVRAALVSVGYTDPDTTDISEAARSIYFK